jgi:redox-sensitive bicupin YhaK (pirin superfamily)
VIVRSAERASTHSGGLDSRHSFAYGSAYDPANTHFGLLLACNEDRLAAGAGFPAHPHRDVEVLTWVVSGALRHQDDAGHAGEARSGLLQRMSAGGGVRHSEYAVGGPAHYVQMWVRPATFGEPPAYDTVPVGPGLTEVTPLRQPDATLVAGRLPAGAAATL